MAGVATYLNFERSTAEAFEFYKKVFKSEYLGEVMYMKDVPQSEGDAPIAEEDKNLVMNVALPILGGHLLMGTDAPESMDFKLVQGNNVYITLMPDTREEADRLFIELAEGGNVEMEMQDMFWGDYYGSCEDKFGVHWMINYSEKKE